MAAETLYALAPDLATGLQGGFSDGPYASFDPLWLSGEDMIFVLQADGAVRPALAEIFQHAEQLGSSLTEIIAINQNDFQGRDRSLAEMIVAKSGWHWDFDRDKWRSKPADVRSQQMKRLGIDDQTRVSLPQVSISVRAVDLESLLRDVRSMAPSAGRNSQAVELTRRRIEDGLAALLGDAPHETPPEKQASPRTRAERFRT